MVQHRKAVQLSEDPPRSDMLPHLLRSSASPIRCICQSQVPAGLIRPEPAKKNLLCHHLRFPSRGETKEGGLLPQARSVLYKKIFSSKIVPPYLYHKKIEKEAACDKQLLSFVYYILLYLKSVPFVYSVPLLYLKHAFVPSILLSCILNEYLVRYSKKSFVFQNFFR